MTFALNRRTVTTMVLRRFALVHVIQVIWIVKGPALAAVPRVGLAIRSYVVGTHALMREMH